LSNDSITGQTGNGPQLGLRIFENLTINGTGINNTGALHSISGINQWRGHPVGGGITSIITLAGTDAGIGVDPDPNPSNTYIYFTNDYSLTVGDPANLLTSQITGSRGTTFHKEDLGQLILPYANSYTGDTQIEQGWVTIQNDLSLGTYVYGRDTAQPPTHLSTRGAPHPKPRGAPTAPPPRPPTSPPPTTAHRPTGRAPTR